jgi:hypothetical protein
MHCPKCGVILVEEAGLPNYCEAGDMSLSKKLGDALRECYVDNVRSPRERPFPARVGGTWFCPGCGIEAAEESHGNVRCPQCLKSLAEFIDALVELHPSGHGSLTALVHGYVPWVGRTGRLLALWRGRRTMR